MARPTAASAAQIAATRYGTRMSPSLSATRPHAGEATMATIAGTAASTPMTAMSIPIASK